MVIPMVSIIFGSLYLYNSREFIELLLSQPINRKYLYFGMYLGIAIPLTLGFALGTLIPFLYSGMNSLEEIQAIFILLSTGFGLTLIFLALSFFISVFHEDKVKGLGTSILLWLFFTVIYDGLILFVVYIFADYPLERTMLFLSLFNPVDLGRILLMLEFDVSAMMGYTGAVFQQFFSSSMGILVSTGTMIIWIIMPFYLGLKRFVKRDF
jgi:Cu-processing system permease protein